ncbi:unnamed protein product [Lepidochelys kempii]
MKQCSPAAPHPSDQGPPLHDGSGGAAALKLAIHDLLETWEDTHVSQSPQSNQTYQSLPRSCKQIKATQIGARDGIYALRTENGETYQTFCDMTTKGGGWTLVASVHENNVYGKCTAGDRWSSQQGSSINYPEGEGNWANYYTFGSAAGSTSDDYKEPWLLRSAIPGPVRVACNQQDAPERMEEQVHPEVPHRDWLPVLRGGEPPQTLPEIPSEIRRWCLKDQQWPRRARHLRLWRCPANCQLLLSKWPKAEFVPRYIQFCVFNSEKAAMALCAGVKVTGCNTEHHCVGGGGFFPEGNPVQCGDFASFDWNSYGTHQHWSISKEMIESAVLLFYR